MINVTSAPGPEADICLLVEGAYPFVAGGVSTWLHDLIKAQSHLTFHLVVLSADGSPKSLRYELPTNVVRMMEIPLQQTETATPYRQAIASLIAELEPSLTRLLTEGRLVDFRAILATLETHRAVVSRAALLNSEPAFDAVRRMYERSASGNSFLNYFWSWRSLVGGLYSVLLAELPRARVYHAISTGYAGLMMARAAVETGRPALLTEHGIYTNERRIEIAMADWLVDNPMPSLNLEARRRDLRNFWTEAFQAYSRVCYEFADRITTLYAGNQVMQRRDGAPPDRLIIIPNGIDYDKFSRVLRNPAPRRPTVALIGRVVPIKDVKTYIRAAALLRDMVPEVRTLLMGPTEEDAAYFCECQDLISHLNLESTFEFTGRVNLHDHLRYVDVNVLTSLSEAQPLVLLEAGAAGIPSVATDVGCCREIILGRADEDPALGAGGFVTPLANPLATAEAVANLLTDSDLYRRCGTTIQKRTEVYYNRKTIDQVYHRLYEDNLYLRDRNWTLEGTF